MKSFLKRFRRDTEKSPKPSAEGRQGKGILVFRSTGEVIRAERVLRAKGKKVRVMGPPPQIQTGCDMVIEFALMEQLEVKRILGDVGLEPLEVVPVDSPLLTPVGLYHVKELGAYLMVRAANMKLTVERGTGLIVNVSGGGCPDVPYLAQELVGQNLREAPQPLELGHTLCGYALQMAFEEAMRRCLQ